MNQEHRIRDVNAPVNPSRVIRPAPDEPNEPETPPARPTLLGVVAVQVVLGLYRAFIFYKFYGWFVLSVAALRAPAISYGTAYGIVLTLGVLRMTGVSPKHLRDVRDTTSDSVRTATLATLAIWTIGFLVGLVAHVIMSISITVWRA